MAKLRLLERIANAKHKGKSTVGVVTLQQSIANNIINILRTAQKTVNTRDDFGMPFYNDIQIFNDETNKLLIAEMAYQIKTFEPRLEDVTIKCDVTNQKGPLDVLFTINGKYENDGQPMPFGLQLTFNKHGQFKQKA